MSQLYQNTKKEHKQSTSFMVVALQGYADVTVDWYGP